MARRAALREENRHECGRDDFNLFVERLGSSAGIDFGKYDSVPVDLSGNKANLIPVVQTFEGMYSTFKDIIPDALIQNVRRCQYERPTPVQRFAIPVLTSLIFDFPTSLIGLLV